MAEPSRAHRVLTGLLVAGAMGAAGGAFGAAFRDTLAHPEALAARARDVRVERRHYDATTGVVRTEASAKASREWLQRLMATGLREARRTPASTCVAACRHCPDQLSVDVWFKVDSQPYILTLHMREGLAFLRAVRAEAWSFEDSVGAVLGLVREVMRDDAIQGWKPPPTPSPGPDVASAAYQDDDVLVTGMPDAQKRVAPAYPAAAREHRVSGVVQVRALVRVDGTVERVAVFHSIPELDQAALDAVRQWTFKPATCGGRPVAVWVIIPVRFTLH